MTGEQLGRPISDVGPTPTLALYPWQKRALAAWKAAGHRGVIEAVTGSGKTRLALAAMVTALRRGRKVAVVVPTRDLARQWRREIDRYVRPLVGEVRVGQLGDGDWAGLESSDVVVAVAASAADEFRRYAGDPPWKVLLIADECHHYGAETWSHILQEAFPRRLGLTATYERSDDGVQRVLDPYFGGVRYSVGYAEALADDVIAHFRVAFAGVRFSGSEGAAYQDADERAREARRRLITFHGVTAEPFGSFLRETQALAEEGDSPGSRTAATYLWAFARRRSLMAECRQKLALVERLAPAVAAADRTIVFAQTVAAAGAAIERLRARGIPGAMIESSMDADEKAEAFDAFERGDLSVVAAPKLLDEGVDVPAADLAIVLATSRSRRQLIQRMGRVIRKKKDGRAARILVIYVAGTAEDPKAGAHEDFLEEVIDAADAVETFLPDTNVAELCTWLDPHPGSTASVARATGTVTATTAGPAPAPAIGRSATPRPAASAVRGPRPVSSDRRRSAPSAPPRPAAQPPVRPRCEKCLRDGALGSMCTCGWVVGTKAPTCPQCGERITGDPGDMCRKGGDHDIPLPHRRRSGIASAAASGATYRVCARCSTVTKALTGPCPNCESV